MMMNKIAVFFAFSESSPCCSHLDSYSYDSALLAQPRPSPLLLVCFCVFFEFKYWNLYNKTIVTEPWGLSFAKLPFLEQWQEKQKCKLHLYSVAQFHIRLKFCTIME